MASSYPVSLTLQDFEKSLKDLANKQLASFRKEAGELIKQTTEESPALRLAEQQFNVCVGTKSFSNIFLLRKENQEESEKVRKELEQMRINSEEGEKRRQQAFAKLEQKSAEELEKIKKESEAEAERRKREIEILKIEVQERDKKVKEEHERFKKEMEENAAKKRADEDAAKKRAEEEAVAAKKRDEEAAKIIGANAAVLKKEKEAALKREKEKEALTRQNDELKQQLLELKKSKCSICNKEALPKTRKNCMYKNCDLAVCIGCSIPTKQCFTCKKVHCRAHLKICKHCKSRTCCTTGGCWKRDCKQT